MHAFFRANLVQENSYQLSPEMQPGTLNEVVMGFDGDVSDCTAPQRAGSVLGDGMPNWHFGAD